MARVTADSQLCYACLFSFKRHQLSGTGWSCTGALCTRSNAPLAGASYPPITVSVNVAPKASSPQINQASVSGGGSTTANASDSTVIIATEPSATSVSPNSGTGAVQAFTATYSSVNGYQNRRWVQMLFAVAPDGGQAYCFIQYDVPGNSFWLYGASGFFGAKLTFQRTLDVLEPGYRMQTGT